MNGTSRVLLATVAAAIAQASSAVFASDERAPRSRKDRTRRSPSTRCVVSVQVTSTPADRPGISVSGTGL